MNILQYLRYHKLAIKDGTEQAEEIIFTCPFHTDASPSCSFNTKKSVWYCFPCEALGNKPSGGSLLDFEMKLRDISKDKAQLFLSIYEGKIKILNDQEQMKYNADLLENRAIMAQLFEQRGITLDTIKKTRIGWDGFRVRLPYYIGEFLVLVKRWDALRLETGTLPKVYPIEKGLFNRGIFPQAPKGVEELVYTEGEGDCLAALSLGFNAITAGSATVSLLDYGLWLKEYALVLCFDNDPAGRSSSVRNAELLTGAGYKVKLMDLTQLGAEEGEDLTDVIVKRGLDRERMSQYIVKLPYFIAPVKVAPIAPIESVPFQEFVQSDNYGKVIRCHVIVGGRDSSVKLGPRAVQTECRRNKPRLCLGCPLNQHNTFSIKPSDNLEAYIGLLIAGQRQKHQDIRDILRAACDDFIFTYKETESFVYVYLVPPPDYKEVVKKVYHGYGFTNDTRIKPNRHYFVTAHMVKHPQTNDAILWITRVDESNVMSLFTEEKHTQFKILQPEGTHAPNTL